MSPEFPPTSRNRWSLSASICHLEWQERKINLIDTPGDPGFQGDAIAALGHEHVMFAADYPFETAQEAGEFMDHVPLSDKVREDIAYNSAAKHFGLEQN